MDQTLEFREVRISIAADALTEAMARVCSQPLSFIQSLAEWAQTLVAPVVLIRQALANRAK